MKRNKKFLFSLAAVIVALTIGIVIGVYTVVINRIVEEQTLETIGELAAHDRNTISMFVEYNMKNLERIGSRLKRNSANLTDVERVNVFLSDEANESPFDKVFLVTPDGSYYTDITYRERGSVDFYDYLQVLGEGQSRALGFDNLPFMKEDKAVYYVYKLTGVLEGITVDATAREAYALVGITRRTSIKAGLVIDSFKDGDGTVRGHSSVVNDRGDYIVNRNDDAAAESYNWIGHIEECEKSGMTADEVRRHLREGDTFWFYHEDGGVRELNYCVPLGGSADWFFLLTVNDEALAEQSNSFVLMIVIALGSTVLVIIASMIVIMLALNNTAKAYAQEKVQSEFLANMSHEMRTPLNGIVGLNYLMMTSIDDPQKRTQVKNWLTKSHATAKYLLSLINDVLDISKLRTGRVDIVKEPLLVGTVIDAIHSMQCDNIKNRGITYSTDVKIDYPCILGDEVRIKQVLMNIVSNAAKFTTVGGLIKLSVSQTKTDENHVTTTFVCEDTGCGMSEEFINKIFDAFTQDRNSSNNSTKGTGLGMAISKMLVNAMGGEIFVKSEQGKGSVFTVELPAEISAIPDYMEYTVDEETERLAEEIAAEEEKPMKILVAEDNELNAEILIEILESAGFETAWAEDGKKAAEKFAQSAVGEFGLILMDLRMPVMDGCEAARAIRAFEREDAATVLIYACTANTFNEDRISAFDSGMNDFLTKPIDIKVLLQKLELAEKSKRGGKGGDSNENS